MANRRKFLAGLGALASGSAAAVGTGAFTTVEAERSVSISVANDTNGYLGLDPVDDAPGNEYVSSSGGTLELSITNNGEGAGVNKNAVTEFTDLFTVTNQGTQDILWYITYDPADGQEGFPDVETAADGDKPGSADDPSGLQDLEFITPNDEDLEVVNYPEGQSANASGLGVGNSETVGLRIDTRNHPNLEADEPLFDGTVTISTAGLE